MAICSVLTWQHQPSEQSETEAYLKQRNSSIISSDLTWNGLSPHLNALEIILLISMSTELIKTTAALANTATPPPPSIHPSIHHHHHHIHNQQHHSYGIFEISGFGCGVVALVGCYVEYGGLLATFRHSVPVPSSGVKMPKNKSISLGILTLEDGDEILSRKVGYKLH